MPGPGPAGRGAAKPELTERCRLGALPGPGCAHGHVARALPKGLGGSASLRLCPAHDGREATLSFNPANLYRVFWNEQAASCDVSDLDIHALLLGKGVDESCLGTYGLRKQARAASPLAHVGFEIVAMTLAEPLRRAFWAHVDEHQCWPSYPRCPEYTRLMELLPEGDAPVLLASP